MARVRYNQQGGITGAALAATTGSQAITGFFAAAPGFATLTGSDVIVIVLEPGTATMEIVWVTVYTTAGVNATITRAQEGTSAVAHASGVPWIHAPTALDFASGTPGSSAPADAAAAGVATTLALSDHQHGREADQRGLPVLGGLTGAVAATRYVGGTATAAPTTGTFVAGDFVIAQNGEIYVCVSAGTPGAWAPVPAYATPAIVLGTAAAIGSAPSVIHSDATIAAFDATAPTTSALADAAAVGSATTAARRDHRHGRESFATPTVLLGTAGAAGVATTPIRSDSTIAAFNDAANPTTNSPTTAAAVGGQNVAARRDHQHATTGPLGTQGSSWFARVTSSQGPTAPPFDITGATVTVTLVSGRRYRISGQALITSSVTTDPVQLAIVEGSTDIMLANGGQVAGGGAAGSIFSAVIRACPGDVTAGSHTYKLSARRNGGGTGNFTNNAGATFPTWILVEDIGT